MPSGRHTQFHFQFLKQVRISIQWKTLVSTPNSLTSQVLISLCCLMYFAVPLSRDEFIDLLTLENVWCVTKADAPWTAVLKLDRTSFVTQQPSSSGQAVRRLKRVCLNSMSFSQQLLSVSNWNTQVTEKTYNKTSFYNQHTTWPWPDYKRRHCNQFCTLGTFHPSYPFHSIHWHLKEYLLILQ